MLIVDECVEVETLTGPMHVRIFRPKDETRKWGGVVFWSEIFAITGPIARAAAILAGHGFVVAVRAWGAWRRAGGALWRLRGR